MKSQIVDSLLKLEHSIDLQDQIVSMKEKIMFFYNFFK